MGSSGRGESVYSSRVHTVSIVIPCYNEVETLEQLIDSVLRSPVESKEVIVVDDASDDGTAELIRTKIEPRVDRVLWHDRNQGKGLNTGK